MSDELELEDLELLLGSEAFPGEPEEKEAPKSGEAIPTTAPTTSSRTVPLPFLTAKVEAAKKEKKHKEKRRKEKKHRKRSRDEEGNAEEKEDDEERDRRPRSKYVLDEADSASEDDSFIEDEEEEEEGFRDLLYQPPSSLGREGGEGMLGGGNLGMGQDRNAHLTDEELGRQYEERVRWMREQRKAMAAQRGGGGGGGYRMSGSGGGEEGGFEPTTVPREELLSLRYTSEMLPQPNDPKVYAVKCKPRMTRILVARIVNKCYAYRMGINLEKKMDLGILSVFSLDHVKEYIYVEAHRQSFVTNALEGLVGLFRFTITQVPPTELLQMLEKKPTHEKILVGELVRLRQFPYRGDIGEVVSLLSDTRHMVVKVVPREDFLGKVYHKTTSVLPQRFFSAEQAVGAEERGDHIRWGELKFDHDGYLLKTVSIRSVLHGKRLQIPPGSGELAIFYRHNRELVKEAVARYAAEGSQMMDRIRIGDTVRVVSGELKNTVGTVTNLLKNTGMAVLSCSIPQQKTPISLRVELCDCTKHFQEGTHVVVEEGPYRGRSGTVVKSYEEVVVLFCDRDENTPEITVKANDCYQSKLITTFSSPFQGAIPKGSRGNNAAGASGASSGVGGSSSFASWSLYDLVRLADSRSVGCIVLFHQDHVDVLTEGNECRNLSYAQVTPIGRGSRKAIDIYQNSLERGAEVSVRETNLTPFHLGGSSGRIEHVFNETVFVRFTHRKVHAGLVAMPASCVLLTGGRKTTITDATGKRLRKLLLPTMRKSENAVMADYSLDVKGDTWQHTSEFVDDTESYY